MIMAAMNFRLIVLCFCFHRQILSSEVEQKDVTMLKKLELELKNVKAENSELKAEVWKISQENTEIRTSLKNMEHRLESLLTKTVIENPLPIISQIHNENRQDKYSNSKGTHSNAANGAHRALRASVPSNPIGHDAVGFMAYVTQAKQYLQIHQTVEFESVVTNVGSAYHANTSVFIAPTDGLYFFSVTILSFQREDIETEIVHNGVGVAYTYSGGETMYGSGTTSAVLRLKAFDDVWIRILNVKVINNGNIRVFSQWSSFCGYKIQ